MIKKCKLCNQKALANSDYCHLHTGSESVPAKPVKTTKKSKAR